MLAKIMLNNNPKISVVMASRNGERFIKEAIDSILGQTFGDFEFLIVDDGSTDLTPIIIDEYAKRDQRIKIITNSQCLGLTKSLNIAIKQAKSEFIARMDDDDICLKNRLEKQYDFVRKNPEIILLGSFAEPEEIVPAFVFLASDESNYITGQLFCVDGGLGMT